MSKSIVYVSALLSTLVLAASGGQSFAKCDGDDPRTKPQIQEINKKWDALKKASAAIKFTGKLASRGKCAATLLRVGIPAPFSLPPDEAFKEAHEAISCLALEKWQVQQECKCKDAGAKFSLADETAVKPTRDAYKDIQSLREKALKSGIPNEAIRKLVEHADEIRSCFDAGTVGVLRSTEQQIKVIIDASPHAQH